MLIRLHRGGLAESMATVVEIESTVEAVAKAVTSKEGKTITPDMVEVEKYGDGIDTRTGWDDHIVTVEGYGVVGFTDGPLNQGESKRIRQAFGKMVKSDIETVKRKEREWAKTVERVRHAMNCINCYSPENKARREKEAEVRRAKSKEARYRLDDACQEILP